jgi:acetyl esterase/lipase
MMKGAETPWLLVIGLLAVLPAPALGADKSAVDPGSRFPVEVIKDVAYYRGKDADPRRHKLDLYLPRGGQGYPLLLFVHGGGWKNGDKAEFEFLGKCLARHGVGVACVNYRLYPTVRFPANVEDVARAFAWTHENVAGHGGRADRLFVGGHSTGGHLVSLLATDGSYLQAQGLAVADVRGVISISGLYSIPRGRFPLFEDSDAGARKASPIRQVRGRPPPFLLVYGDHDFPRFGAMAEDFAKALKDARCDVTCMRIQDRTHGSVAARITDEGDPVRQAILGFVAKHTPER